MIMLGKSICHIWVKTKTLAIVGFHKHVFVLNIVKCIDTVCNLKSVCPLSNLNIPKGGTTILLSDVLVRNLVYLHCHRLLFKERLSIK